MSSPINKQTIEKLAKLARIELPPREEEKILKDLGKILDHFNDLQNADVANAIPMTGGTTFKNIFREDDERENTNAVSGTESFPETKDGFLKIPPVFSAAGGSAPGGE